MLIIKNIYCKNLLKYLVYEFHPHNQDDEKIFFYYATNECLRKALFPLVLHNVKDSFTGEQSLLSFKLSKLEDIQFFKLSKNTHFQSVNIIMY